MSLDDDLQNISINGSEDSGICRSSSQDSDIDDNASKVSQKPDYSGELVAYNTLLLLGIGCMLPWNAFITAKEYYAQRLCGSSYEASFENYFSLCFSISQPFGVMISLFYGHKISLQNQVRYPLLVYALTLTVITITVCIHIDTIPLFWMTAIFACLCGISSALMNSGLYGIAGLFPSQYTSAVMTGSSLAGLIVSSSSLISQAASITSSQCLTDDFDDDSAACSTDFSIDYSALGYFLAATLELYVCIVCFEAFIRSSFLRYYMKKLALKNLEYECNDPNVALISTSMSLKDSSLKDFLRQRASLMASSYHSHSHILVQGDKSRPSQSSSPHHTESSKEQSRQSAGQLSWNSSSTTGSINQYSKSYTSKNQSSNQNLTQPLLQGPNPSKSSHIVSSPYPNLLEDRFIEGMDSTITDSRSDNETPRAAYASTSDLKSVRLGSESTKNLLHSHSQSHGDNMTKSTFTLSHYTHPTGHTLPMNHQDEKKPLSDQSKVNISYDTVLSTLNIIKVPAFSEFINFVITLSAFPAVIVLIKPIERCPSSSSLRIFNSLWIPILFVAVGLFDFVGRYSAQIFKNKIKFINAKNVWIFAISRSIVVMLLLFCNIQDSQLPRLFLSDIAPLVLVSIHGFSSGYIANLSMMLGPELVPLEYASLAGTIMVVALVSGLVAGSLISFLLVYVLRGDIFA